MSQQNQQNQQNQENQENQIPFFNFENVSKLLTNLEAALNTGNQKGCYTLNEAAALKRSLEVVNQIVNVTKVYQNERILASRGQLGQPGETPNQTDVSTTGA